MDRLETEGQIKTQKELFNLYSSMDRLETYTEKTPEMKLKEFIFQYG